MRKATEKSELAVRGEGGFTILELMIVLGIIALIMGVLVIPRLRGSSREAKIRTTKIMMAEYVAAYEQWSSDNTEGCPQAVEELAKYRKKKETRDGFGSAFIIKCGDAAPEGVEFGLVSMGPDKKPDTSDDIRSWDEEKK